MLLLWSYSIVQQPIVKYIWSMVGAGGAMQVLGPAEMSTGTLRAGQEIDAESAKAQTMANE